MPQRYVGHIHLAKQKVKRIKKKKSRRLGSAIKIDIDRRQFDYTFYLPERRRNRIRDFQEERRSGIERRSGNERRCFSV